MLIKKAQMDVLLNIIGAVETGGQIYGKRRYDDYTPAYANCSNEISCTIGAYQEYGALAKGLLKEIRSSYPTTFKKYDTAGIGEDLNLSSWNGYSPAIGSNKAKAIVNIINSTEGRIVQDKRIERQMRDYIAFANSKGVVDVDALFMCANFIHQGGYSACSRILGKTKKPYTLDRLYAACKTDTGNQVGAYRTRQSKVYGWLKQYLSEEGGTTEMNVNDAIDTMIQIALKEVGYLEKATEDRLDHKTANAGRGNYTKYWRALKASWNGQPWCAVFVSWVMEQAFGRSAAKKLLHHESDFPFVYCPTLSRRMKLYSTPKRGDVVLFWRRGKYVHTGIVIDVEGSRFWTVEGNTSGGSTIIPNGGAVCVKIYSLASLSGTRFARPNYAIVTRVNKPSDNSAPIVPTIKNYLSIGDTGSKVKDLQKRLNALGYKGKDGKKLVIDGMFGESCLHAVKEFQRANNLTVDGLAGNATLSLLKKLTTKPYTPWVGYCTKDTATVYEKNKGSNVLSSYPKIAKDNLVDVIGESGSRYKIKIAGKYIGYVSMYDIHNKNKKFPSVGMVVTKGGTLNLRKKAVTGDVILKIANGEKVVVKGGTVKTPDKSRWYKIKYKGKTGFVSGQYLKTI